MSDNDLMEISNSEVRRSADILMAMRHFAIPDEDFAATVALGLIVHDRNPINVKVQLDVLGRPDLIDEAVRLLRRHIEIMDFASKSKLAKDDPHHVIDMIHSEKIAKLLHDSLKDTAALHAKIGGQLDSFLEKTLPHA